MEMRATIKGVQSLDIEIAIKQSFIVELMEHPHKWESGSENATEHAITRAFEGENNPLADAIYDAVADIAAEADDLLDSELDAARASEDAAFEKAAQTA